MPTGKPANTPSICNEYRLEFQLRIAEKSAHHPTQNKQEIYRLLGKMPSVINNQIVKEQ